MKMTKISDLRSPNVYKYVIYLKVHIIYTVPANSLRKYSSQLELVSLQSNGNSTIHHRLSGIILFAPEKKTRHRLKDEVGPL